MGEKTKRIEIGVVGIDSGTIILIDPAHVKNVIAEKVKAFLERDNAYDQIYSPGEIPICMAVGNFGGDGFYPVYATVTEKGLIRSLEIVFEQVKGYVGPGPGVEQPKDTDTIQDPEDP